MATRIKTEGLHVILQDTGTSKIIFDLAKAETGFRSNRDQDKVFFVKAGTERKIGDGIYYLYTEILNGDDGDAAFASMAALKTYLRENTGFKFGELPSITTADIFSGGFIDYNDSGSSQPITIVGSPVTLENDGAGAFTNKDFVPTGVTELWDVILDTFDWSELKLGDMIDIRLDLLLTTVTPNTEVKVDLHLGTGGGSYIIPFINSSNFKSTGSYQLNRFNGIYLGDANTLDNGGQFKMSTDQDCSVVVIGWYIKIIQKG